MRNWVIALILIALCTPAHAALVNNPESFEYCDIACPWWPCHDWESWGSGSGSGGWAGGDDWVEFIQGDGTDGDCCLQTAPPASLDWWGYSLAFTHGTPIVPGQIYEYFFDYKCLGGQGVFKLEFYDAENNQLSVTAWDPYPVAIPNVWHHFSYTFRAPANAAFVTPVVGATGVGAIMRYDLLGILPTDCTYELEGDEDGDCRVTLNDLALMLANWLVDCIDDPTDPACITP